MQPVIEKLCGNFKLGEAPHWDAASQMLYFVDINGYSIHRYVPATRKHTSAYIGKYQNENQTDVQKKMRKNL